MKASWTAKKAENLARSSFSAKSSAIAAAPIEIAIITASQRGMPN
jgi:hypothetical protein